MTAKSLALAAIAMLLLAAAAGAEPYGSGNTFPLITGEDAVAMRWKRCFKLDLPADVRAAACLHIITDGHRDDSSLWLALGDAYAELHDSKNALDAYGHAIEVDGSREPLERRAVYYAEIGSYDSALADLKTAMAIRGPAAEVLNVSCWLRAVANRDLPQGFADCQAALKKNPADTGALDSRGFILFRNGQMQDAMASYDSALAVNPKLASPLYMRGVIERRNGNAAAASADIAAALAIDPAMAARYQRYGVAAQTP